MSENWQMVTALELIEKYYIQRNKTNLHQAQATTCTINLAKNLLGKTRSPSFSDAQLLNTTDLSHYK